MPQAVFPSVAPPPEPSTEASASGMDPPAALPTAVPLAAASTSSQNSTAVDAARNPSFERPPPLHSLTTIPTSNVEITFPRPLCVEPPPPSPIAPNESFNSVVKTWLPRSVNEDMARRITVFLTDRCHLCDEHRGFGVYEDGLWRWLCPSCVAVSLDTERVVTGL